MTALLNLVGVAAVFVLGWLLGASMVDERWRAYRNRKELS